MAAPLLIDWRRHAWLIAVVVIGAAMGIAALSSPDRQRRIVEEQPDGPMREIAGEAVTRIRLHGPHGSHEWRRGDARWTRSAPALDTAIRLLRYSVPERRFEAASPEFGLDAPALRVEVFTGAAAAPAFETSFGATNPIGLARYARVRHAGRDEVLLLSAYVAQAWEALEAAP